jgi:hypothetical protein
LRLPSIERDSWELRSGEVSHAANPKTFWIPPLAQRQGLRRGDGVKLDFDIEAVEEDGSLSRHGERMWVIVTGHHGDTFIGILDNQPEAIEPGEGVYLQKGAEIPFLAEHVVDIDLPPAEYVKVRLAEPPLHRWPPDEQQDAQP